MATDFVKLRENVLAAYDASDHWKNPAVEIQVQVSLKEQVVDMAIAGMKLIEASEDGDITDLFEGLAASLATVILNWTNKIENGDQGAIQFVPLILRYVLAAQSGGVSGVKLKYPTLPN